MRRAGTRFLIVALLVLLMAVPLFMAASVVGDRRSAAWEAQNSVAREWAGEQTVSGPRLVVPVTAVVTSTETLDTAGTPTPRTVTRTVDAPPLILLPEAFTLTASTAAEIRRRSVFDVPVYTAALDFEAGFTIPDLAGIVAATETVQWQDARLVIDISHNKGLRGEAALTANDRPLRLEPVPAGNSGREGIEALPGDPRGAGLVVKGAISLRGSGSLRVTPVGRISHITLAGDWPHPRFAGVLPNDSATGAEGFSGDWTIPHLARTLPQLARGASKDDSGLRVDGSDFPAVFFLSPNDFYQKAYRATRYAVLMIALTFLTVWLVEDRSRRPAHPVQYLLIGLAQALFAVLMVAYAEHIGFGPAYLGASAATVALLTLFGATGLKLGRRTWVLTALLIALYAVLWLILQSIDYALLAGVTLAFLALAATMVMTRDENWYGSPETRAPPAPAPDPPP